MAQTLPNTGDLATSAETDVQLSRENREKNKTTGPDSFREAQLRLAWEKVQVLIGFAILVGGVLIWNVFKSAGQ